jgi:hypothetical protein
MTATGRYRVGFVRKVDLWSQSGLGAFHDSLGWAAKNAADLDVNSCFGSAYRSVSEDIPSPRNNPVCYDFKEKRIVSAT